MWWLCVANPLIRVVLILKLNSYILARASVSDKFPGIQLICQQENSGGSFIGIFRFKQLPRQRCLVEMWWKKQDGRRQFFQSTFGHAMSIGLLGCPILPGNFLNHETLWTKSPVLSFAEKVGRKVCKETSVARDLLNRKSSFGSSSAETEWWHAFESTKHMTYDVQNLNFYWTGNLVEPFATVLI